MKFDKLFLAVFILSMSACSTLDSIFPDRKKEYKETSTIPPLEVPPDLTTSSIEDALPLPNEVSPFKTHIPGQTKAGEAAIVAEPKLEVAYSTLITGEGGGDYLRLNDPFPSAWRTTGKALANLAIEIEDRNRSLGTYYIRYTEILKPENEGFFSWLFFWEEEEVAEEKSYQIKLKEDGSSTTLQVQDGQGQPMLQGVGIALTRELHAELKLF
jgi:uncharacterized lipoprotein